MEAAVLQYIGVLGFWANVKLLHTCNAECCHCDISCYIASNGFFMLGCAQGAQYPSIREYTLNHIGDSSFM